MKRGTIEHPKTKKLARELGIEIPFAAGLLECLWHWAAKFTPQGNAGKFDNDAIADGIQTTINPDKLIEALVKSGYFERHETHRLIIHDWHEHCDDTVHNHLARRGLFFWNGVKPRITKLSGKERDRIESLYEEASACHAHNIRSESEFSSNKCGQPEPLPKPEPLPGGVAQIAPPPEKILEKYHELCPSLRKVEVFTDKRRKQVQARLKKYPEPEFWDGFFKRVEQSDFLGGRAPPGKGYSKPFLADFEWITNLTNFTEIIEGKYDNNRYATSRSNFTASPDKYAGLEE